MAVNFLSCRGPPNLSWLRVGSSQPAIVAHPGMEPVPSSLCHSPSLGSNAATADTANEAVAPRPTRLFMSGAPRASAVKPSLMMARPGPGNDRENGVRPLTLGGRDGWLDIGVSNAGTVCPKARPSALQAARFMPQ